MTAVAHRIALDDRNTAGRRGLKAVRNGRPAPATLGGFKNPPLRRRRAVVYWVRIMASVGKVHVRLFARLADVAGTRSTEVELGEGLTAGDAYRVLCRRYPGMDGLEGTLMYAVNAEYVTPDHPLRDGDELALIPPVSGGSMELGTQELGNG